MSIFGRFWVIRSVVNFFLSKPQKQLDLSSSVFSDLDAKVIVESLFKDGLWLGLKLPGDMRQEILDYAIRTECYANSNPSLGFHFLLKKQAEQTCQFSFNKAEYVNTSLTCPTIYKLANDSFLLEIASKYLNSEAVFTGSRLWWLFPVDDETFDPKQTVSYYHYDLDDYNCVRFFFYVTDVDLESGPHICIRGSHRKKKLAHLLSPFKRRNDEDMVNYYGEENIITICGEAGFGFAEDTNCYHKAERPRSKNRLILQIQYAMKDYGNHNDLVEPSCLKNVFDNFG